MTLAAKAVAGQSEAVYQWHWEIIDTYGGPLLTLSECQALVDQIWYACRDTDAPRVRDGRGHPWARANRRNIQLPRVTRMVFYIIHEIAHSLSIAECGTKYLDPNAAGHGWYYANIAADLYTRYGNVPAEIVSSLADKHGVNIKRIV